MLIEFKSRATGTITMTGDGGTRILAVLGRAPEPRGIITVAQLPAAIAALEAAVAAEKAAPPANPPAAIRPADEDPDNAEDEAPAAPVTLAQRAWPVIEMFRRALAAETDVTWGS